MHRNPITSNFTHLKVRKIFSAHLPLEHLLFRCSLKSDLKALVTLRNSLLHPHQVFSSLLLWALRCQQEHPLKDLQQVLCLERYHHQLLVLLRLGLALGLGRAGRRPAEGCRAEVLHQGSRGGLLGGALLAEGDGGEAQSFETLQLRAGRGGGGEGARG